MNMKTKVEQYLLSKKEDRDFVEDVANSLEFVSYGGSYLYGTNEHDADFDMRAMAVLNEDYILGLREFDHYKPKSGTKGITSAGDLDVEVFHYDRFFQGVRNGETIPVEMLHTPKDKIVYASTLALPFLENKELFFSKNLVRHYKGMIFRLLNEARANIDNLNKKERIARVERYGYETKSFMKCVLFARVVRDFFLTGEIILARPDAKELLTLKHGAVKTIEEAEAYVHSLLAENEKLMKASLIPDLPDFEKLNAFMKEYNRFVLEDIGVITF